MVWKSFQIFYDPNEFDDRKVFDDPKGISIISKDFDNPRDKGETSIFDGVLLLSTLFDL